MSIERYQIPLPLLKEAAGDYNLLIKCRICCDHSSQGERYEKFIEPYSTEFDVLVSDMIHLQDDVTKADLILWLYPVLNMSFIHFEMLENALTYSLIKLGEDGPLDLPRLKLMFNHAKTARSVKELEYALLPETLFDVPLVNWTDAMFDGFYASMIFDDEN